MSDDDGNDDNDDDDDDDDDEVLVEGREGGLGEANEGKGKEGGEKTGSG